MSDQNYEEYWSLTNAFTDYNGDKFLATLKICIDFIDKYTLNHPIYGNTNKKNYQIHR